MQLILSCRCRGLCCSARVDPHKRRARPPAPPPHLLMSVEDSWPVDFRSGAVDASVGRSWVPAKRRGAWRAWGRSRTGDETRERVSKGAWASETPSGIFLAPLAGRPTLGIRRGAVPNRSIRSSHGWFPLGQLTKSGGHGHGTGFDRLCCLDLCTSSGVRPGCTRARNLELITLTPSHVSPQQG